MRTMGPQDLLIPKKVTREGSCSSHQKQASRQYRDFNDEAGSSGRQQGFEENFLSMVPLPKTTIAVHVGEGLFAKIRGGGGGVLRWGTQVEGGLCSS